MRWILPEAQWHQRIIEEVLIRRKVISEIARTHHVLRMTIHSRLKRYGGTQNLPKARNQRPRLYLSERTSGEKRMIRHVHFHRKTHAAVCLHLILSAHYGYKRSLNFLCRVMRRFMTRYVKIIMTFLFIAIKYNGVI